MFEKKNSKRRENSVSLFFRYSTRKKKSDFPFNRTDRIAKTCSIKKSETSWTFSDFGSRAAFWFRSWSMPVEEPCVAVDTAASALSFHQEKLRCQCESLADISKGTNSLILRLSWKARHWPAGSLNLDQSEPNSWGKFANENFLFIHKKNVSTKICRFSTQNQRIWLKKKIFQFRYKKLPTLFKPCDAFFRPVIIEVPHFASLRGKEREIVILRSDNGETWREHTLEASEEAVQDVLNESFEGEGTDSFFLHFFKYSKKYFQKSPLICCFVYFHIVIHKQQ